MGIKTVAVYEALDETSLHIRVADECVLLESPRGFLDQDALLNIARAKGADAIHPGYGFLAENLEFAIACRDAGILLIAPPLETLQLALDKIETLRAARQAGFNTIEHSAMCANEEGIDQLRAEAERLGYPVIVKSCRGGRGRAGHVVRASEFFDATVQRAQHEAQAVYGASPVYLEKMISPAHQISVQILADGFGAAIHLGERDGSLLHGGQKVLEESPAPCINSAQREQLAQAALTLTRTMRLQGAMSFEFLVDPRGEFYFTEIKPRIQIEHPLTEMRARLDLVRAQILLAANEPLGLTQADAQLHGWAMACRIHAQDSEQNFLPSPGRVRVRFPNGPETRTDTYIYSGCFVPAAYDPLIAKITVWGPDRATALARLERALHESSFRGIVTNVPWLEQAVASREVSEGTYSTETDVAKIAHSDNSLRDLAVAAALSYVHTTAISHPQIPARVVTNWHRSARTLPE